MNINSPRKYNIEKLAKWYNILNTWEWPEDFPYNKPVGWDSMKNYEREQRLLSNTKSYYISIYMNLIKYLIGEKECLRYHHLKNIIDKNYKFEIWWIVSEISSYVRILFPNFYIDIYKLTGWRKSNKTHI